MPYPTELDYWMEAVSIAFPTLSQPQARVLALYSYGMAVTKRCGQTVVIVCLALLLGLKSANLRQRFKEFTYEATQKRGTQRREVVVEAQFAWLLKWVLQQWHRPPQVVIGMDVTYLKDRYTILCISVLYHQTAIPVAWKVLPGNAKGEWHPLWLSLLSSLSPALPRTCRVLVLLDSGLYSKRLFEALRQYGWHPFMRLREQGYYKRCTGKHWQPLQHLAYRGMTPTAFKATCFKNDPLQAVVWVQWDVRHDKACLLLSDLTPSQVKGNPYPLRMWIEAGFKDFKRGGLHWEQTKLPSADRMARLMLVMSVALFYLTRLGTNPFDGQTTPSDPVYRLSVVTRGWLRLFTRLRFDLPLSETFFTPYTLPHFYPE